MCYLYYNFSGFVSGHYMSDTRNMDYCSFSVLKIYYYVSQHFRMAVTIWVLPLSVKKGGIQTSSLWLLAKTM